MLGHTRKQHILLYKYFLFFRFCFRLNEIHYKKKICFCFEFPSFVDIKKHPGTMMMVGTFKGFVLIV